MEGSASCCCCCCRGWRGLGSSCSCSCCSCSLGVKLLAVWVKGWRKQGERQHLRDWADGGEVMRAEAHCLGQEGPAWEGSVGGGGAIRPSACCCCACCRCCCSSCCACCTGCGAPLQVGQVLAPHAQDWLGAQGGAGGCRGGSCLAVSPASACSSTGSTAAAAAAAAQRLHHFSVHPTAAAAAAAAVLHSGLDGHIGGAAKDGGLLLAAGSSCCCAACPGCLLRRHKLCIALRIPAAVAGIHPPALLPHQALHTLQGHYIALQGRQLPQGALLGA